MSKKIRRVNNYEEAKPLEGQREELGPVTSKITVITQNTILGGNLTPPSSGSTKKFILMTMDDPWMSIDGIKKEIDPGRGTTPVLLNNRTMVTVRFAAENLGAEVDWINSTRQVIIVYY